MTDMLIYDGASKTFSTRQWTEQEIKDASEETKRLFWSVLRAERNALLMTSDWTQTIDAPVDQAAWAEYRQALRDLPANTVNPENPVWPEPPTT